MCFSRQHSCRICPYLSDICYANTRQIHQESTSISSDVIDGHETPFSIKVRQRRELSRSHSNNDIDNMTAADVDTNVEKSDSLEHKPTFYLQQKKSNKKKHLEDQNTKQMKKSKKSSKFLHAFFRKRRTTVFGQPLSDLCDGNNLEPPEAIIKLMVHVYQHGPHTPGILRKSNNAALGREIREKIDNGDNVVLEDHMTLAAATVFKEFLRSIPGGLLTSSLHDQWLTVKKDDPYEDKIDKIKKILLKLPAVNYHILKLTICLLQHLAKHSADNLMGPSNLATCIVPSLYELTSALPHGKLKGDAQKQMHESVSEIQNILGPLVSFMITKHEELFGEDILGMFVKYGCQASPAVNLDEERYDSQMQPSADEEDDMAGEEDDDDNFNGQQSKKHHLNLQPQDQHMLRESNSGTDSDSMHSILSLQDVGMGLQRDDSSIDSLGDREYYAHESPRVVKSHLSPSNLSRDSGLTLSDNQLYDEETYHADLASVSARMFHQMDSHIAEHHDTADTYSHGCYNQSADAQFDRNINPIAPPRRRSVKKKISNVGGNDGRQHGFVEYSSQQANFKHISSTTHLDVGQNTDRHREHKLMTHSFLDKKLSTDSIGEEHYVVNNLPRPMGFQRMKTDVGISKKSESGAHLFLDEETPTKISTEISENNNADHFMRQSLDTNKLTPVLPELRHSHSSCDSVISDSTYSISQDGSINSTPQTPDEPQDKSLMWLPDVNMSNKPWVTGNFNTQQFYTYSQSTLDLPSRKDSIIDQLTSPKPRSSVWPGKFHEAEEVQTFSTPHLSLMDRFNDVNHTMDPSTHSCLTSAHVPYKQRFYNLGSPPPNVVLRTLPTASKSDVIPLKFNYDIAQAQRSSVDSHKPKHNDLSTDMQYIRHEDYIKVTSKPIIISPDSNSSRLPTSAATEDKLSKYISSTKGKSFSAKNILSQSQQCQDMPLSYQQAIQRNFLMKHNIPAGETEAQRENSAKAKAMYEKSIQIFHEQSDKSNLQLNSHKTHALESQNKVCDQEISDVKLRRYRDTVPLDYTSHSFQSDFISDHPDDSGASGFLDMGSVSHSLQEDIVIRHKICAESNVRSANRSSNPGNVLLLPRNESIRSDTGSSSGSSVTISTLSRHSDSCGCASDFGDISSVTVSSVTSNDSSSEVDSSMSKNRFVNRIEHHSDQMKPGTSYNMTIDEMMDSEDEVDDGLKIDPEQLYLQSMKIYEQKVTSGQPLNKPFQMLPSHHPQWHQPSGSETYSEAALVPKHINSPKERSPESKARLNVSSFSLHRSHSDSEEHAHKQGTYSSHAVKTRYGDSQNIQEIQQTQVRSLPRDIKTELHQNFLKAKSCFHQPEITKHMSTSIFHNSPAQIVQNSSSYSPDNKSGKLPQSTSATVAESALSEAIKSKGPYSHLPDSSMASRDNKTEFHWSVKDLKSKYDKDKIMNTGSINKPSSQMSSRPHSPPPYQNPPPFKHFPDSASHSTSNNTCDQVADTDITSPKSIVPQKQGPQSYIYESLYGMYSSSDDSCNSPPNRSPWLSGSSEELSDYSNTTYI